MSVHESVRRISRVTVNLQIQLLNMWEQNSSNKNTELRSFDSSEDIGKKLSGPYCAILDNGFSYPA